MLGSLLPPIYVSMQHSTQRFIQHAHVVVTALKRAISFIRSARRALIVQSLWREFKMIFKNSVEEKMFLCKCKE